MLLLAILIKCVECCLVINHEPTVDRQAPARGLIGDLG